MIRYILIALFIFVAGPAYAAREKPKKTEKSAKPANPIDAIKGEDSHEPTFIDSDSLTLNSNDRTFAYLGNVKVVKGDMTLTSERMDGSYSEDNKIKSLVAKKNVVITKGPTIRATSEKATYDAVKDLITLVENPEITQDGNTLSADTVKIFLQENRSVAEGQVRMKMLNGTPTPTFTPVTPAPTVGPGTPAPAAAAAAGTPVAPATLTPVPSVSAVPAPAPAVKTPAASPTKIPAISPKKLTEKIKK
jgi:lipopolysaccharide export system protein LptA